MKRIKDFSLSVIILIFQVIASIYFWLTLAEGVLIPSHFNLKGEVDSYMTKEWGIAFFPLINLGLFLLMFLLPLYSPRFKKQPERFQKIIPRITFILIATFSALHIMLLSIAKWQILDAKLLLFILLGILFILLGNLLPKLPSNFFIGIRSPWTLSSEENWQKTHRVGGYSFVFGGIVMIINGFVNNEIANMIIGIVALLFLVVIPLGYSFLIFQQAKKANK